MRTIGSKVNPKIVAAITSAVSAGGTPEGRAVSITLTPVSETLSKKPAVKYSMWKVDGLISLMWGRESIHRTY